MPEWKYRLIIDPNQRVKILLYPLSWIKTTEQYIFECEITSLTSNDFTYLHTWMNISSQYIHTYSSDLFCFIQSCEDGRCFSKSRQTPQMAELEGFYVTKCCWRTVPMSRINLNSTKDTGNPLYREFSRMPVALKYPQSYARKKALWVFWKWQTLSLTQAGKR